jgi:hypothetical protein
MLPCQGRSRWSALLSLTDEDEEQAEDEEAIQRLAEQWKFDSDDRPALGPQGADEQDRIANSIVYSPTPLFLCQHWKDIVRLWYPTD